MLRFESEDFEQVYTKAIDKGYSRDDAIRRACREAIVFLYKKFDLQPEIKTHDRLVTEALENYKTKLEIWNRSKNKRRSLQVGATKHIAGLRYLETTTLVHRLGRQVLGGMPFLNQSIRVLLVGHLGQQVRGDIHSLNRNIKVSLADRQQMRGNIRQRSFIPAESGSRLRLHSSRGIRAKHRHRGVHIQRVQRSISRGLMVSLRTRLHTPLQTPGRTRLQIAIPGLHLARPSTLAITTTLVADMLVHPTTLHVQTPLVPPAHLTPTTTLVVIPTPTPTPSAPRLRLPHHHNRLLHQ
jgi:hypothetical protein